MRFWRSIFCIDLGENFFVLLRYNPNMIKHKPCPISPNITPNKNGNVINVNNVGLISR